MALFRKCLSGLLGAPRRLFNTTVANERWHRDFVENRILPRYGYQDDVKVSGPLPRLRNDSRLIRQMRLFMPVSPFSRSQALFGQNDYIDILGHDDMHPTRVHYHIPKWIRGFQHGHHFQALIHKNKMFGPSGLEDAFPIKYQNLQKRLRKYWYWQRKNLNQKRWTNYVGIKFGPVPNRHKTRYPF